LSTVTVTINTFIGTGGMDRDPKKREAIERYEMKDL